MIKINPIYDYKTLERVTLVDGTRYYIDPEGNKNPSVTTILSKTADQPQLERWRERVGVIEANRVRDEATGLGSLMHAHLECYVTGQERPSGNNLVRQLAKAMADQVINRGLVKINEIWGIEQALYYPGLYAGTADLCGVHKNVPSIMDHKTCKKMKSREMIRDYALQLAAYSIAHNEVFGTTINKGVIYMVSRDLEFKEFVFEGKEFFDCKDEWLCRVEQFLKMNQKEPALL